MGSISFGDIKLNGKFFTITELQSLCKTKIHNPKIELWEKDIYKFLIDWFSTSDTITVKTSGSTGKPKKIQLKKKHMIASANATLSFFSLKADDNAWLCLPINYIAGKMMIVRGIVGKLNIIYSKPMSLPIIDDNQKIDFVAMVPNQVFELLNTVKGKSQLKRINNLLIGGSAISNKLESDLIKISNVNIWQSYGMTETITHIAIRKIQQKTNFSNYHLLPGINITTNHNSQLIIDAPAIGVNKLLTNDIIKLHNNESFTVISRIDNVIVSGGIKLHPEIIEAKINKIIPNNLFIGGVPDTKLGMKLVLFIEEINDTDYDIKSISKILANSLTKLEIPKEIIYVKEFTRTESKKLLRNDMINRHLTLTKL